MKREIENNYYQIGEVSKICNIAIRTLHYYDEIDLIKPSVVDSQSNYRYYSPEQIPVILVVKNYKTAGFTLKQIKKLISRESIECIQLLAKAQCDVIDRKILELTLAKERLQLYTLQNEERISGDDNIQLKEFAHTYVAYIRYKSPCTKENFYLRYAELCKIIEANQLHMVGTMMAVYYEAYENPNYENMDFEVCVRVAEQEERKGIVKKFGGFLALTAIHYGSYERIPNTCLKMFDWMNENNYLPYGPYAENYIIDISSTLSEENYITELIRPVKKST